MIPYRLILSPPSGGYQRLQIWAAIGNKTSTFLCCSWDLEGSIAIKEGRTYPLKWQLRGATSGEEGGTGIQGYKFGFPPGLTLCGMNSGFGEGFNFTIEATIPQNTTPETIYFNALPPVSLDSLSTTDKCTPALPTSHPLPAETKVQESTQAARVAVTGYSLDSIKSPSVRYKQGAAFARIQTEIENLNKLDPLVLKEWSVWAITKDGYLIDGLDTGYDTKNFVGCGYPAGEIGPSQSFKTAVCVKVRDEGDSTGLIVVATITNAYILARP